MNFFDQNVKKKVLRACWMDYEEHIIVNNLQQYFKIQLPFYRRRRMKLEDCKTKFDYWLYNISNMKSMETTMPFMTEDKGLAMMNDVARFNNMTLEELLGMCCNIHA